MKLTEAQGRHAKHMYHPDWGKDDIKKWLDSKDIRNYTINDDLTVDVNGHVSLHRQLYLVIPVKFGTVTGKFDCSQGQLVSLKNSPQNVGGSFICFENYELTTLKGCPKNVKGVFAASDCNLKNLNHLPPTAVGYSLGGINTYTSLTGIHKKIFNAETIAISHSCTTHILGVMLIKTLKGFSFTHPSSEQIEVAKIINKHLQGDRDPLKCQEELIQAGYAEYAKL